MVTDWITRDVVSERTPEPQEDRARLRLVEIDVLKPVRVGGRARHAGERLQVEAWVAVGLIERGKVRRV